MSRIIVALDFNNKKELLKCVNQLDPKLCRVKLGKEAFTRFGPALVEEIVAKGFDIFLDLKFHDIPSTVAKACLAAADLGVWMVNVHAQGGSHMMEAAREALLKRLSPSPLLIAVTVLTSFTETDLREIGIQDSMEKTVLRLAELAKNSGMDGVVCSAHEASMIRKICGDTFLLVTPGIRLEADNVDDQARVMTPTQAIEAGSDYLVIGRSITRAADPLLALQNISCNNLPE